MHTACIQSSRFAAAQRLGCSLLRQVAYAFPYPHSNSPNPSQVQVNTSITSIKSYLDHIVASTNMQCLTPPSMLDDTCGYVTANLYAKSVFGEDALVNLSVE